MPELTVLIPCFNEAATAGRVITRVRDALSNIDHQLIIIDDGSTDDTVAVVNAALDHRGHVVRRDTNGGKTAAVRDGLALAIGDYVIIQDADLEYDPADILTLLKLARGGNHVAVYGKRPSHWSMPSRWLLAGGVLAIDLVIAVLHGRFVRDHATCYKMIRRDVLDDMHLQTSGFEGCVEITCKLLRRGYPIVQVPIEYVPRPYSEGKKLTWRHGFAAIREAWRCRSLKH